YDRYASISYSSNDSHLFRSSSSQYSSPARLSCRSSSEKPSGLTSCTLDFVARQSRPTLPVFGGISGSTRTTLNIKLQPRITPISRIRTESGNEKEISISKPGSHKASKFLFLGSWIPD